MTTYTEKRFFQWYADDIAVTLRAESGSYGGGSEVLVIQKVYDPSRRHAYEEYPEVCETVQAAYGTGGGNVPIVVTYKQYRYGEYVESEHSAVLRAESGRVDGGAQKP